jgi:hypothetical protein
VRSSDLDAQAEANTTSEFLSKLVMNAASAADPFMIGYGRRPVAPHISVSEVVMTAYSPTKYLAPSRGRASHLDASEMIPLGAL